MVNNPHPDQSMPVGVVVRRSPGVTRWAAWSWKAVSVLPGAAPADWRLLREEGGVAEFHAATPVLQLHPADSEAYLVTLSDKTPAIYVVMRQTGVADRPLQVLLVTASPYEAQDYMDNGEDVVEKLPMPSGLVGWISDFVNAHYEEEIFVKRRRDRKHVDLVEDGVGDARIAQMTDVYRAPGRKEPAA